MSRAGFILGGYVGFGNAGDELIARAVRGTASGAAWRTLGVDASRWNPLSLALRLRSAKALVYGGGELFQTRTSRRSFLYYAALARLARVCGARFAAYGMGLDPELSRADASAAASVLNLADRVWFRDEASLALFKSAGGRAPASVAPDPAWVLEIKDIPPPYQGGEVRRKRVPLLGKEGEGEVSSLARKPLKRILWIPRHPADAERFQRLASFAGGDAGFLLLHPAEDRRAFGGLPGIEPWADPEELVSLIQGYDAVVSMRYHGLVLAALAGRPAVALAAHPKVAALAAELGQPSLPADGSAARLMEALQAASPARAPITEARRGLKELAGYLETL